MKKRYKVFASLYDDLNSGWIWIPVQKDLKSMDYIEIKTTLNKKRVICNCRIIDDNFRHLYNQRHTNKIDDTNSAIVISYYYRYKLGELKTGQEYEFEIRRLKSFIPLCTEIRANLQHPDNVVKLATCLALLSVLLAILSIVLSILV